MIALLVVVALSIALAMGGAATYTWLTETRAFPLIAAQAVQVSCAVGIAVCLTMLNLLLRWLRWNFLLRRFHVLVPTRETFRLFFATLVALLTPFYLGELLRGAAVARRYPALTTVVFWVWLVERCSDVAALLLIWGLCLSGRDGAWYAATGGVLLVLAPWLLARLTLRRPDVNQRHTGQLGVPSIVAFCAGTSLIAWLLPVLSLFAILALLAQHDPLALAGEVFASGTLLGGLTGTPGGLGTTGGRMIMKLSQAGMPPSTASVAVLVLRFGTQWFAVALGIVLAVVWRRSLLALVRTPGRVQQHFDELAPSYADNIPEHFRKRMLERKIDAMLPVLPAPSREVRGLDLGCGQAWYTAELSQRGYTMHGIDLSQGQIAEAKRHCETQQVAVDLRAYDGVHIPFPDAHFDFVYSINVLHHVPSPDAQRALMGEVLRVLKPQGQFLLHEMNVENALFRGYVSYVFPLLKSIDEGTELWIRPTRLPTIPGGVWQSAISYFNFFPEFLPEAVLQAIKPLERWLEASPLRRYSAHYMAVLRRDA